ncbi:hypothetical protein Csa_023960, partial [Cucumis sativus]
RQERVTLDYDHLKKYRKVEEQKQHKRITKEANKIKGRKE